MATTSEKILSIALTLCSLQSLRGNSVDDFKAFISNPPVIESIVWERLSDTIPEPSPDTGVFYGKWQRDSALVAKCDDLARAKQGKIRLVNGDAAARFLNNYWLYYVNQLTLWIDTGRPEEANNNAITGYRSNMRYLDEVINLGIPKVGAGSIIWQGDAFEQRYNEGKDLITGRLVIDDKGRVAAVDIGLSVSGGRKFHWMVSYDYLEPKFSIPSDVNVYNLGGGGANESNGKEKKLLRHIKIHDIKIAASASGGMSFDARQYLPRDTQTYYVSGAGINYKTADGDIASVAMTPSEDAPSADNTARRRFLLTIAVVTVIIFGVVFTKKTKSKT